MDWSFPKFLNLPIACIILCLDVLELRAKAAITSMLIFISDPLVLASSNKTKVE